VGGREDAADQFATFLLLELGEDGSSVAAHAAVAFARIVSEGDSLDDEVLGDEHPLGQQRALNVICWVYGSNPTAQGMKGAAEAAGLPEVRLTGCANEFQSMRDAWLRLLGPHLKHEPESVEMTQSS
jgi:hypothetical protein